MTVPIVLLAAGASRRLGTPKQLVELDGAPLLRRAAISALASSSDGVVAVLGAHYADVLRALEGLPVRVVENTAWAEGIASSIRRGVDEAVVGGHDAVLLAVVDQLRLSVAHLDRLLQRYRAGAPVVASRYEGVLGVPALFRAELFPCLRALRGDEGARRLLVREPSAAVVEWADGAFDLDTPEQLIELAACPDLARDLKGERAMRGVLLDVDGTLLNSNDAHAHAWAEAIEGAGLSLPYEQIRQRIGAGGDKLLWEVMGVDEHSDAGEHVVDAKNRIFRSRYLADLAPTRGARELLVRMRREGLRLVVASSAAKSALQDLLVQASVADLVDERVTAEEAGHGKPDPDIVRVAVERTHASRHDVVLLGDTPYDVEAAARAGVKTIALRCGGWSDESLRGALAVYDDPADLLWHYDDSPLGARREGADRSGTHGSQARDE